MKLSGNLKAYYDVLDEMGIIAPLLQSDWSQLDALKNNRYKDFLNLIDKMNQVEEKENIKKQLVCYDAQMIQFFAMEVAKEYAEFHNMKAVH